RQIVQAASERIKIAGDVLDYADFFLPDEAVPVDDKAFDKRIRKPAGARALLRACLEALRAQEPFDAASLEQRIGSFVEQQGVELGDIIHPWRGAGTGKGVGFGLYETLAALGKQRSLARIERALQRQ